MFHPHKSKSSVPTPPAVLVRGLTSRRDPRALAAASTAIALSLGFTPHDPNDTPSVRERDTSWKTAYDAARMAVDGAKESSDTFLPLKAVVGALSILSKNYDVSMTCSRTGHLLIDTLCPFPAPASIG